MVNYTHFVSTAGLVMNDKEEVLLLNSPWRGWEFPGGMVEPHETLQKALIREIEEETGIQVEIIGFCGMNKNVEMDIVNIDFICKYISGNLKTSEESKEVKWVSKLKALEMVQYPLNKKRLSNMLSYKQQMYCFGFTKEPFQVINEELFDVGIYDFT